MNLEDEGIKIGEKHIKNTSSIDDNNNNNNALISWSTEQVASWLTNKGHGQYVPLLCVQHKLDGIGLIRLREIDLRDPPVSIQTVGDIKRIYHDVDILRKQKQIEQIQNANKIQCYDVTPVGGRVKSFVKRTASFSDFLDNTRKQIVLPADIFKNETVIIKPELTKMFVAFLYVIAVSWILCIAMVIVNERVPDMEKYPPLPDILLDSIPFHPVAFELSEYCCTVLLVIWLTVCLLHKHRTILLRRFFALMGTAYLLRSITVLLTSLSVPGAHLHCKPRSLENLSFMQTLAEAYVIMKGAGFSIRGVNTCGDYFFSGHTTFITFLNFFITEYTPNSQAFYALQMFTWLLNIFALGFILASHEHYSIDVFAAFYLTTRLFLYYHSMANNQALYQKDARRVRIWFPLFGYLESSMITRVPNEYQSLSEILLYVKAKMNETLRYINIIYKRTENDS